MKLSTGKFGLMGMSLVEVLVSAGILAGIFAAGTIMIQNSEQGQRKINLGIERNNAFDLIGKILKKDGQCNSLLQGRTFNADIAANLQSALPLDIQKRITITSAILRDHPTVPAPANGMGPVVLDVTAQFLALGGGNDISNYRFFLEAQFDGSRNIVFCTNSFVTTLSTTCTLLGGTLSIRDVDGDGLAQEVACQLPDCPVPGVLSQLYLSNPTVLSYPSPLVVPYRDHDAISRYCLVQDLSIFLAQIAPNPGRYVLQAGNDTMSGTLEGTGAAATFQTNADLIAQRWGIAGSFRTNLQPPPCPNGSYASGVNADGTLICSPSPLDGCTPVCPIPSELCRGFFYNGSDGCGGVCNVTGTRPPACVSGGTDPNVCLGQPSVRGNGCGGTCNLTGTKTDGVCAPTPTPTSAAATPTPTSPGPTPTPTSAAGTCYLVSKSFVGINPPTLSYPASKPCNDLTSEIRMRIRCPGETRQLYHFHIQRVCQGCPTMSSCSYPGTICSDIYLGLGILRSFDPGCCSSTPDTYDIRIKMEWYQAGCRTNPVTSSSCSTCWQGTPVTHLDYKITALCFSDNGMVDCKYIDDDDLIMRMTVKVKP